MWCLVTLLVGVIAVPADVYCLRTINTVWPEYKIYYPIFDNTITFDVWAGHDAWIAFTNSTHPTSAMYEVVLGANRNTKVLILRNRLMWMEKNERALLDDYDYRGFWIKIENNFNDCITGLNLSVGRKGNALPFVTVVLPCIGIQYFALATTGEGNSGYWKINGLDENTGIHIKQIYSEVRRNCTYGFPDYFNKYYKFPNNNIRLRVQTRNYAWVRLTPDKNRSPNYEIKINEYTRVVSLLKNGKEVQNYFSIGDWYPELAYDFWIDFNFISLTQAIICVGVNLNSLIRYTDNNADFPVKYVSLATVCTDPSVATYSKLAVWYLPQYILND